MRPRVRINTNIYIAASAKFMMRFIKFAFRILRAYKALNSARDTRVIIDCVTYCAAFLLRAP